MQIFLLLFKTKSYLNNLIILLWDLVKCCLDGATWAFYIMHCIYFSLLRSLQKIPLEQHILTFNIIILTLSEDYTF